MSQIRIASSASLISHPHEVGERSQRNPTFQRTNSVRPWSEYRAFSPKLIDGSVTAPPGPQQLEAEERAT